jgi:N-acetyl-gamma-glutamyl-phosphate reductase
MGLSVALAGATGYTGMKLLQILRAHPDVGAIRVGARSESGAPLAERLPFLLEAEGLEVEALETLAEEPGDAFFLCLPAGAGAALAERGRAAGARVIDLGGDLRLQDGARRALWYPHAPAPAAPAVYGLSEWARPAIAAAELVANPGCYATAALLALAPAVRAGLLAVEPIIIDAKSGVSGAGRNGDLRTHLAEMHDQIAPYASGRRHRHVPEIEQALSAWAGAAGPVIFTPHLVPADRGVLASVYARLGPGVGADDVRSLYESAYAGEPYVRLLPAGAHPDTRSVRGSNRCDLALSVIEEARTLLIFAALDNLMKGAAGQAVQNFNLMFGLPETRALPALGDPL